MRRVEKFLKLFVPPIITAPLRNWRKRREERHYDHIPDRQFYDGVFSPWLGYGEFGPLFDEIKKFTLVSPSRAWVLYSLARQSLSVPGNYYEAGVFRGGTALLLKKVLEKKSDHKVSNIDSKQLRLFDTFCGMPETDAQRDLHRAGDFADTSLESVKLLVGTPAWVSYHPGIIPASFTGLETDRIAFAHIDLDIYQSILDSCRFIYPRLSPGGIIVFDDYGFMSCPGAREAVDRFFADKLEIPLVLPTGQAIVIKL
ncbi:MAG: TylF/MycF/NovP-related O-methyltransferase [Rhodocyclaceae bacterium]|nr:TylF/MycF/NovP-related O-methyltransferase [Rhodocyclaceae bacterium]